MIPSEEKLPALELWALDTARQLAPSLEGIDRLRLAIGLIQARAQECRHISGELTIGSAQSPAARALAIHCYDRSAKLEEFGCAMAERGEEDQKPKVIQ